METLTLEKKVVIRLVKETAAVRVVCHGNLHHVVFLTEPRSELTDCDCGKDGHQ